MNKHIAIEISYFFFSTPHNTRGVHTYHDHMLNESPWVVERNKKKTTEQKKNYIKKHCGIPIKKQKVLVQKVNAILWDHEHAHLQRINRVGNIVLHLHLPISNSNYDSFDFETTKCLCMRWRLPALIASVFYLFHFISVKTTCQPCI